LPARSDDLNPTPRALHRRSPTPGPVGRGRFHQHA